jgi:hypothetical protein
MLPRTMAVEQNASILPRSVMADIALQKGHRQQKRGIGLLMPSLPWTRWA